MDLLNVYITNPTPIEYNWFYLSDRQIYTKNAVIGSIQSVKIQITISDAHHDQFENLLKTQILGSFQVHRHRRVNTKYLYQSHQLEQNIDMTKIQIKSCFDRLHQLELEMRQYGIYPYNKDPQSRYEIRQSQNEIQMIPDHWYETIYEIWCHQGTDFYDNLLTL